MSWASRVSLGEAAPRSRVGLPKLRAVGLGIQGAVPSRRGCKCPNQTLAVDESDVLSERGDHRSDALGRLFDRCGRHGVTGNPFPAGPDLDRESSVAAYRTYLDAHPELVEEARRQLQGHDLACWCPSTDRHGHRVPCHADVLLEVANS